jgi:hypothetical protein
MLPTYLDPIVRGHHPPVEMARGPGATRPEVLARVERAPIRMDIGPAPGCNAVATALPINRNVPQPRIINHEVSQRGVE